MPQREASSEEASDAAQEASPPIKMETHVLNESSRKGMMLVSSNPYF